MHTATDPADYVLASDVGQLSGVVLGAEIRKFVCLTWAEVGLPVLHLIKLRLIVPRGAPRSYIHAVSVSLFTSF